MMMLIGEMVGCLIVAAGIGVTVGWMLRHLSVRSLNQHVEDMTTALQDKEQALHSAQLEFKAKSSALQIYENKIISSEAALRAAQEEAAAQGERFMAVERELLAATQRISTLELEHGAALQRFNESDATIAVFELEARQSNAARTAAQQALSLREEQLVLLQERVTELEGALAETDRLKALVADMEPAQGRVHWLEVQLSEKDVQQRIALHELEEERAALVRRIAELEPLQQELQKQAIVLQEWESKHHKMLKQQASDAALVDKQRATIQEMRSTLAERDRSLKEKESQSAALRRQLDELRALQAEMRKREQPLPRPRKRHIERSDQAR